MKKSELEEKLKEISNHISESALIETLYDLAKKGAGGVNQHGYHTEVKYNLEYGYFKINLNDGWGQFGGGELKVFYQGEMVLYLDRNSDNKENIPNVNGWGVLEYHKGEWEKKVKEIEKKLGKITLKREKETYNEESEVPKDVLEKVKEKYDLEVK